MRSVIYLTDENPRVARDLASALVRNGYEVVTLPAPDVVTRLRGERGNVVVLADADRGGLDLAREVRAARPDAAVVYTAAMPQKVPEAAKVRGAPMLRSPITSHQLVGIVGALAS